MGVRFSIVNHHVRRTGTCNHEGCWWSVPERNPIAIPCIALDRQEVDAICETGGFWTAEDIAFVACRRCRLVRAREMELRGKTALVTGGAARIGKAVCEALAREGCRVLVHYRRSSSAAAKLVRELLASGVGAASVEGTLDSESACRRIIARALEAFGSLDVLVNNASVFHKAALADVTERKLLDEFRVNLFAPIFLTREFARRKRKGHIVNILDRRISGTEAGCLPYLLSKKALAEFTTAAALELAPRITVNGVAPGPVLPPRGTGRWKVSEAAGHLPLGRRPSPVDVASAVVFLLKADATTGQVIYVDGGQHLLGDRAAGR